MKKPVALCLVMVGAVFACMCMCSGVIALAGGSDSDWEGPAAPIEGSAIEDRLAAPDAPTPPEDYNYDYNYDYHDHSGWYKAWSIFSTMMLILVVGGVIGMAFYSSRRLPSIQKNKRQSII